jgi:UDPglucose 6-dehydrogenase
MALKITVIGTGYLGATHAAAMAELGFDVLGLDVVPEKIEMLAAGKVPMYEPGLEELLRLHVAGIEGSSGRLRFTTSYEEAGEFGDIHFMCVNTPQKHGEYACDMSYVDAAFASLAPHLKRPALVVGKSTVPVGSAERLARLLAEKAPAGQDVELAWNPEFLREGFAVDDTLHPDRIVVGVRSERAEKLLREVYATPLGEGSPFVVTDFPTAELVKTAANSFLATKISFINAMAEVCEAAGGHVPAAAACRRTSAPSWHARASWARTRRSPSSARSTRSTCAAAGTWWSWRGKRWAARRSWASGWPCSARRSSRTRTTSATRPR